MRKMDVNHVTEARKVFEDKLNKYALSHGYTVRGHLWTKEDHYLTARRDNNEGPFIAEKRDYGTGARVCDLNL